jgi:hypothetical protein
MRVCASVVALAAAGCLRSVVPLHAPDRDMAPSAPDLGTSADLAARDLIQQAAPDLSEPPEQDLSPNLSIDLAGGLVDCFGFTLCDSALTLCIKYMKGTPGNPSGVLSPPACYAPDVPCLQPSCACLQADPTLATRCGYCFDNGNATFTCYQ